MKHFFSIATLLTLLIAPAVFAADEPFSITVEGIENGKPIPEKFAYCIPTEKEKSSMTGKNISPKISWVKGPEGTKSYALVMVDPDVPTKFDDAGKEGKTLAADMPRQNFYHWAVINIPANITEIKEGAGKTFKHGAVAVNDYLKFTGAENTKENQAKFRGYDGPCPPWNDARMHNYHFKLFALKTKKIDLKEPFPGAQAMEEINKHAIATAQIIGTYTLNPELKK